MRTGVTLDDETLLLEATGIAKAFPGVKALDNVCLRLRRGTLNAVVGENGAGKSTLMKILAGVFPPDAGEIRLDGQTVRFRNPREAQRAGVSIIFQELNLVPNLSVAENIFLGREPRTRLGFVDFAKMHRDASQLLVRLGLKLDSRRRIHDLGVASQQVVEIAKALSYRSRMLILDEPTSALTEQEVVALFRIISQLKADGVGLVYITHRLEELTHLADDVTVFRDGKLVATRPYAETTQDELVRLMVGRENLQPPTESTSTIGESLLTVEHLTLAARTRQQRCVVEDVSFSVARGEILGVFGLMGAGRTELLQAVFGLFPQRTSGRVVMEGQRSPLRTVQAAITAGLALVPEDRKTDGLVLDMGMAPNVSLPCFDRVSRWGVLQSRLERGLAQHYVDRLDVKASGLYRPVRDLSGGNQQKVVLAKWLATHPNVLLLDEPTRGIDVGAKQEIYALIRELAASGLGVVMVSSELPEVLSLSDRILVLSEGKLAGEFSGAEATEDLLLERALPTSHSSKVA